MNKVYMLPNPIAPSQMVYINENICVGCNSCTRACRRQVIMPNPEKGKAPVVLYPDECWFCGCCVEACSTNALCIKMPINMKVFFKRKSTNEVFRIGQKNAPKQTYFTPPAD